MMREPPSGRFIFGLARTRFVGTLVAIATAASVLSWLFLQADVVNAVPTRTTPASCACCARPTPN